MTGEDRIQSSIVTFIRSVAPTCVCFAVPNGGKRSMSTAKVLKATGTLAGVSDLVFIMPGRLLFAEIKTATGRVSKEQRAFGMKVQDLGHLWAVWRSIDDVRHTFAAIGFSTREVGSVK